MGITPNFDMNSIKAKLDTFQRNVDAATYQTLQYLGELLVNFAKDNITFTPRTGNLQNSIGYVITKNGKIVHTSGFGGASAETPEGQEKGLELAQKIAKKTPNAYALIIVAGMNYAAKVEAMGYNVILPAELLARVEFPKELKKLVEKAKAKAKMI